MGGRRRILSIPLVLTFYGVLAIVAVLWDLLRGGVSGILPGPDSMGLLRAAVLGLAFAALVVIASRMLERRFRWARKISEILARTIGPLRDNELAVYAVASGVAEELFFRGAMQPAIGFWLTSAIFALAHGGFDRNLRGWVVMAGVVGMGLGALQIVTGGVLAPVIAHFTINYFELHALDRLARRLR